MLQAILLRIINGIFVIVCEACDVKGFPDDSSSTLRNSSETESSDDEDIEDRAAQILKDDLSYSDPDLIPNYSPSLEGEDLLYSPRGN